MREEDVVVLLDEVDLGVDVRVIVQVGLVDAHRDAELGELGEVGVVDEDARRVVGVDDEDELGLVGDGGEHGGDVVLQVGLAKVDLHGRGVAEAGARREHLEGRVGAEELVARLQEDAHHRVDGLGGAVGEGDVLRRQAVELAELLTQAVGAVRVAVALLGHVGDRLDDCVRRRHRVLVQHHAAHLGLRPGLVEDGRVVLGGRPHVRVDLVLDVRHAGDPFVSH